MDQGGSTASSSPTLVDGEHLFMDQGCSTASTPTLVDGYSTGDGGWMEREQKDGDGGRE